MAGNSNKQCRYAKQSLKDTDGIIIEIIPENIPENIELFWSFGGTDPAFCKDNVFSVEGDAFTLYYGESMTLRTLQGCVPPNSDIRLSDARQQASPTLRRPDAQSAWNSGRQNAPDID